MGVWNSTCHLVHTPTTPETSSKELKQGNCCCRHFQCVSVTVSKLAWLLITTYSIQTWNHVLEKLIAGLGGNQEELLIKSKQIYHHHHQQ